jgi:CRP-like cAMP-binding protein
VSDFPSVTYANGERIFTAGDVADQLFVIQQGQVELLDAQGHVFTTLNGFFKRRYPWRLCSGSR